MRLLFVIALSLVMSSASAQTTVVNIYVPAQAAAEQMARRGVLAHCRNAGGQVEGIGFSTVSADDAIRRSCYWNQRKAREIGVARGSRGWYAVIRYY